MLYRDLFEITTTWINTLIPRQLNTDSANNVKMTNAFKNLKKKYTEDLPQHTRRTIDDFNHKTYNELINILFPQITARERQLMQFTRTTFLSQFLTYIFSNDPLITKAIECVGVSFLKNGCYSAPDGCAFNAITSTQLGASEELMKLRRDPRKIVFQNILLAFARKKLDGRGQDMIAANTIFNNTYLQSSNIDLIQEVINGLHTDNINLILAQPFGSLQRHNNIFSFLIQAITRNNSDLVGEDGMLEPFTSMCVYKVLTALPETLLSSNNDITNFMIKFQPLAERWDKIMNQFHKPIEKLLNNTKNTLEQKQLAANSLAKKINSEWNKPTKPMPMAEGNKSPNACAPAWMHRLRKRLHFPIKSTSFRDQSTNTEDRSLIV